ncbi:MAG: hypothetical protein ACRES5_02960, partial [Pseudomonas sp.]
HLVDQTVLDQGFNAFWSLHQLLLWVLYYQTRESHSLYGNPLTGGRGCRLMNIAEAHNVPNSSGKTDDHHGSFQIIAEPASLVAQGH